MWKLSLLLLGQVAAPISPADAISQAHADLARLPPAIRETTRYLSLYATAPDERLKVASVLNGHCNMLSREPRIAPLAVVPGTQSSLIRLNLLDYQWDRDVWEKLLDPHFTATVESVVSRTVVTRWEGGIWPGDNKFYKAGAFTYEKPIQERKGSAAALAPWLADTPAQQAMVGEVARWTQSKIPVVNATWFFNQTAAAANRTPNYYDFLGIKDRKSFDLAVGADRAAAERIKSELREAVALSGMTLNPRAIHRFGKIDGAVWETFDFADPKDKRNALRVLGRDIEDDFTASEVFAHLPNGLWATGLFDLAGKTQASAPPEVASDSHSRSNDRRVHVNASCIRCHADGGLQDIAGWVRNLTERPLELRTPDYAKRIELENQYARALEPFIARDRMVYEGAIKAASGMDSKTFAAAYGDLWSWTEDRTIGLNDAAAALGTTPGKLRVAIDARIKAGYGDTVLSALVVANPRLNRLPIRVFEESIPEAHLTLRGLVQP